jgi:single-strand DNA-binding protein
MWFRVKAFNDRARNAVKSLKKGTPVIVQGRLAQREYEVSRQSTDSEGQPITVMEKRMDLEIENATIAVDLTRGSAPYTREYWNTQAPEGAPAVACASGPTGGLNRYGEQEIVGQSFGSSAQPDIETDAGETGDPEVEQIAA